MRSEAERKRVDELVRSLLVWRVSSVENELCHLVRQVSESDKLKVVEVLGAANVRLAAAVARRTHLAPVQQAALLSRLLVNGGSNEIKYYVLGLFVYRLRAKVILGILHKNKESARSRVSLAAYYVLSSRRFNVEYKNALSGLARDKEGGVENSR
ncbi:hypothetical protein ACI77J_28250 [Pseudomonas sp. O64]|uniref:hypothetical protein n=1 Tax=Pseudomonas TaxID=286 RepID=UPI001140C50D|nr:MULTISPECIES: hypothetical protein [unclassified Pseudomonas]MCV2229898.1 hypothetical protein [Pseudomonas sp. AU10]UNM20267.1 hypothetical protein K0P33_01985 [Pseudomonas sp. ArH3a]UXZ23027.1 hypothetical protein KZH41_01995 [Pseudomonas sp. YeP6b]